MSKSLLNTLTASLLALIVLVGCTQDSPDKPVPGRWYTPNQLALGKPSLSTIVRSAMVPMQRAYQIGKNPLQMEAIHLHHLMDQLMHGIIH